MARGGRERTTRERVGRERVRTERVAVAMPEESRPAAWLRNFRLSGFALSILLLVVSALIVLAPGLKTLIEQRQQIAQLEQSVQDAQDAVDDLGEEIARWSDPAYIEAQARERLYYVYPGDITFLVVGAEQGPTTADGLPISDEIQTTRVDWVRGLLSTFYQAGLTTATPDQLESPAAG
jgi:cell division protein FtsB